MARRKLTRAEKKQQVFFYWKGKDIQKIKDKARSEGYRGPDCHKDWVTDLVMSEIGGDS